MPKITVHGGPSNAAAEPIPRPGEGKFFQPDPGGYPDPTRPYELSAEEQAAEDAADIAASKAALADPAPSIPLADILAEHADEPEPEGDGPSPGSSSSASPPPTAPSSPPSSTRAPSRVRSTAPRSSQRRTGADGTALTGTTGGQTTDGGPSASPTSEE